MAEEIYIISFYDLRNVKLQPLFSEKINTIGAHGIVRVKYPHLWRAAIRARRGNNRPNIKSTLTRALELALP